MSEEPRRLAVVLFNLGGPDRPEAVRPFLRNLFADPAIIDLPPPLRKILAELIARSRNAKACANYAIMGGASPLLANTRAQALALQAALQDRADSARVFVGMRYWEPFIDEVAKDVAAFAPTDVVLAPLFPQFSTTTSGSALAAWRGAYRGPGRTHGLCCWFANRGFIEAHVGAIKRTWETAGRPQARLLFSAHGLPLRTAARGDPYAWQIEETCKAVIDGLEGTWDWRLCYQSRVGPMKWLGPSTPDALRAAAADRTGVIVVPISFVSEHIETLVELDRDYRRLAEALGLPFYLRVPALGADPAFIGGLAEAVIQALGRPTIGPEGPECPAQFAACGRIAPARSRLQPAIEGAA